MFEKVQSLPANNGNSWLMTAACHAPVPRLSVCPWSCSCCLEPDLQWTWLFGLARTMAWDISVGHWRGTPACCHATWARHGRLQSGLPALWELEVHEQGRQILGQEGFSQRGNS